MLKWRLLGAIGMVAVIGGIILAAQAPASPTFEAASVKVNKSGDPSVTMQAQPGGRLTISNATLQVLLRNAYRVGASQIIGGPSWVTTDHFDIVTTAAGNPSQAEIQVMMRALLADRFKLAVHNDTREIPVYALMMARSDRKPGRQLRLAAPCFSTPAGAPPQTPPPGSPEPCGVRVTRGVLVARGYSMTALAALLSNQLDRIVLDRTTLAGMFDVDLRWTPDASAPADADAPSIFAAVQEQLGLKLESTTGPVDVLVIDHVEHPTEN